MADIYPVTNKMRAQWKHWYKRRPPVIKQLAERFPPWKLFRMKSTGHKVFTYSFNENGTMTVVILGKYNLISMERRVFGIPPEDLEECDLPAADEPVGVFMNDQQQLDMTNAMRAENNLPPLTLEQMKNWADQPPDVCAVDAKR